MSLAALALVLVAAVVHATWNLLAKRAGGGVGFLWLFDALTVAIYAPLIVALIAVQRPRFGLAELVFIVGTAVIHLAYFVLLQQGYRSGDLSVVYPLARGTGPLLATAVAIPLFGERPTPLAVSGAVLIAACAFVIAGGSLASAEGSVRAVRYGLLTGATIAAYTLWDKQAVAVLLVPPLLLYWGGTVARVAMTTPLAIRRWPEIRRHWQVHRREAIGIAVLNPVSYVLVLTALVFAPVSYVAPAREVSILIGAVLGARLLAEGQTRRRLAAAGGIVVGLVALTLG